MIFHLWGINIGEAAVIDKHLDFAIYVSIALIKPLKKFIDPYFLNIWLNSPLGTHNSTIFTYGKGVSQGNLNLNLIRNFVAGIPSIIEQKRIVSKVNSLMALCDQLGETLSDKEKMSRKMLSAVVSAL